MSTLSFLKNTFGITDDSHLLDLKVDYIEKFGIDIIKPLEFLKFL